MLHSPESRTTTSGVIDSAVGPIRVTVTDDNLTGIHFCTDQPSSGDFVAREITEQLEEYFAGSRREFTLSVDLSATSNFTRRVLEATAEIPYGETRTYSDIASAIGQSGANQAVGNALGSNPVPIVIPCHRVIRADGSMGWFTGGPDIKRALLAIEDVHFPEQRLLPL